MAFTFIVTNAGRAALVNADNTGTAPVTIAAVGVSANAVSADPAAAALPGEVKRIAALSGDVVADDTIHLIVRDESADVFTVRSLALYLSDGTLFGLYGQADVLLEKSAQAMLLLAIDVRFEDVDASTLTFGDSNFLNPPATTAVQGVVELATDAEATSGSDGVRAVTPKGMKAAVTSWINTRFGDNAPSLFVKQLLSLANAALFREALGLKSAALKDAGAGNGLDADLLDGKEGSWYGDIAARLGYVPWGPANDGAGSGLDAGLFAGQLPGYYTDITARLGYTPWHPGNDGANSGLDADLLDGQQGSWYADIAARLGYTPLNAASYTAADVRAKLVTVDGAGSGIDADLLDGQHASHFLPAASYTAADVRAKLLTVDGAGSGIDADLWQGATRPIGFGANQTAFSIDGATNPNDMVVGSSYFSVNANNGFEGNLAYLTTLAGGDSPDRGFQLSTMYQTGRLAFRSRPGAWVEVLTRTGMGAGSGLDADLLDGYHAADLIGAVSSGVTGYVRLPSGLILCWGAGTANGNGYTQITYPISFASWSRAFVEGGALSTDAKDNGPFVYSTTATGFSIYSAIDANVTISWFAIGF